MNWGIKKNLCFPSLVEFPSSRLRSLLDLQYRSILIAEKELDLSQFSGRILDFGCGTQELRQRISGKDYFSVDPYFPATWKNLSEVPQTQVFELVAAVEVFEHLRDPAEHLQRLSRHQVSGQKIYLTTPFLAREHGAPEDFQRWTEQGLEGLLQDCGYRVEKIIRRGGLVSVLSSFLNFSFFQLLNSRYFVFGLLLAPLVVIMLLLAHMSLKVNHGSPYYLGLSVLASKRADL